MTTWGSVPILANLGHYRELESRHEQPTLAEGLGHRWVPLLGWPRSLNDR